MTTAHSHSWNPRTFTRPNGKLWLDRFLCVFNTFDPNSHHHCSLLPPIHLLRSHSKSNAMMKLPALCSIFLLLPPSLCHMEISWPYPLRSKFNPATQQNDIDYSMTSPLNADGSNFPCKGYQNDRPIEVTATYAAGSTYNMTLAGTATHEGGSCQGK